MCGIAGFTRFHGPIGDETTLVRMGERMRHRGPDADGTYLTDAVGLHHRRLSIVDLSAAGTQPMHSRCGRYVIVFNGEIYNFLELRETLAQQGYEFRTRTDTEVILALYAKKGRACLDDLNGMFAFALWDSEARSLFLARDRIGKKPLYYTFIDGDIAFASELKALVGEGLASKTIRPDALYDYVAYGYVPDPKSIFEGSFKLPPAHCMHVTAEGHVIEPYWDITFDAMDISDDDAIAAVSADVEAATRRRMIADVPLGAFLSGGVDSSGIVATMARISETPVVTCSIGFDDEAFDETAFAREVAEHCGTDHHEFTVKDDLLQQLANAVRHLDEPFADPSLLPTWAVSKVARSQVTVALAGDGGDEVFAGYEKYQADAFENRLRGIIPAPLRKRLLPLLAGWLGRSNTRTLRRAGNLLASLAVDPAMGFYRTNAQITDEQWQALATPGLQEQLAGYHPSQVTLEAYARQKHADHLSRILYADLKTWLPGDILVKVDRMSMANSLEVRAPLLDYQLMERAAQLPSRVKLREGSKKWVLKAAFSSLLPQGILTRRKRGFVPPLARWLRGELRQHAEDLLFNDTAMLAQYFLPQSITRLWNEHQNGTQDHSQLLWTLLICEDWAENMGLRNTPERAAAPFPNAEVADIG